MIKVIPVAASNIAWSNYLRFILDYTGKTINKKIDSSGLKLSDYEKFIKTFDELHVNGGFNHIYFSFLILIPNSLVIELHELTQLKLTSLKSNQRRHRIAFVTGSLEEWQRSIPVINTDLAAAFLSFFNKTGLKSYFRSIRLLK